MNKTKAFVSEESAQILQQLAEKSEYALEQIYMVYVKAQPAIALADFIHLGLVAGVSGFVGYKVWSILSSKAKSEPSWDKGDAALFTGMALILTIFFTLMLTLPVRDMVLRLLAPEYMALEQIIDKVQTGV